MEIKQSQAIHRERFWHKNGKLSKGHDFLLWTIQILFVQILIVTYLQISGVSGVRTYYLKILKASTKTFVC